MSKNVTFFLKNFDNPLGSGLSEPLRVGLLGGRALYISFWIYTHGKAKTREIVYTFYQGEPADAKLELPDNVELARKILDAEVQKAEIGWVGKLFGSRKHAPTNIAGMVLLVSLIALGVLAVMYGAEADFRSDIIKIFGAIAIAALGYVFGSWSRSDVD